MSETETKIEDPGYAAAKELFEYEMTQVRIMLEGEFASISGKDMHKEGETFIDEEKLRINEIVIDDAQILPVEIAIPETPDMKAVQSVKNAEFEAASASKELLDAMNSTALKLPVIPETGKEQPAKQSIAVPDIKPFPSFSFDKSAFETDALKTDIRFEDVKPISIPKIEPRKTDAVTLDIPAAAGSFQADIPAAEPVKTAVEIPQIAESFTADIQPVKPVKTAIAIPKVPAGNIWKEESLAVTEPLFKIDEIEVPDSFDIDLSKINDVKKESVSIADLKAAEDRLNTFSAVNASDIRLQESSPVQISLPEVPEGISWTAKDAAEVEMEFKPADAAVLDFSAVEKAKNYKADVKKTDVNNVKDYSFKDFFKAPESEKSNVPESVDSAEKALAASKVVYTYEDIMNG